MLGPFHLEQGGPCVWNRHMREGGRKGGQIVICRGETCGPLELGFLIYLDPEYSVRICPETSSRKSF